MNKNVKITIVGGGIVGCSIAYELTKKGYKNVVVIERNSSIPGLNQSSRNGGIIHAGLYYPKDVEPLKAKLCVEGNKLMHEFCEKYKVPHKKTGKFIIALTEKEEKYLDFFLKIGKENKVPGIKKISGKEAMKLEPNLKNVIAALYLPTTGSAALTPIVKTIKSVSEKQGAAFLLGTEILNVRFEKEKIFVKIKKNKKLKELETDFIINAAGLYADVIARMINPSLSYDVVGTRGELVIFDSTKRKDIALKGRHIYETPFFYDNETSKKLDLPVGKIKKALKSGKVTKTLGAHLSPAFDETKNGFVMKGSFTIGPIKTFGLGKEDYSSQSKKAEDFISRISVFFPHLKPADIKPRYTGIMAVLKGYTDFIIEKDKKHSNCINLVGMDSPAFTACFAIGRYVREILE